MIAVMLVPPLPVVALLVVIQIIELAVLIMPFPQPNAIGLIFPAVPVMVIAPIIIVIAHSRCTSAGQYGRQHRSAQHQGPQATFYSEHFAILLGLMVFFDVALMHAATLTERLGRVRGSGGRYM